MLKECDCFHREMKMAQHIELLLVVLDYHNPNSPTAQTVMQKAREAVADLYRRHGLDEFIGEIGNGR